MGAWMTRKEKIDFWLIPTLCAIYSYCGLSTSCHIPAEAIRKQLPQEAWDFLKKILRKAEALGLIYRKGGTKSYGLTKNGLSLVKEACLSE